MNSQAIDIFEKARPRLFGLAYRLLGTVDDAEDAVQDCYVKWINQDLETLDNPDGWLTTTCTHLCLDTLKSARKSRTDYVGPWLPEPLHTTTDQTPESEAVRSSSLTTAFLLLLERLNPKERAAYLLHVIFGTPHKEIAITLGVSEAASRKLVSRAKSLISQDIQRFDPPMELQKTLLKAFFSAVKTGNLETLTTILADDVEFTSDGGGKVPASRRVLVGLDTLFHTIKVILQSNWSVKEPRFTEINASAGLELLEDGKVVTSITIGLNADEKINRIYVVRNPDKLNAKSTYPAP
ncbi:MAG: RNA polymerase sigma factor SigJ [Sneathiellales bacterium]|nr:RNA polymerase sigma factor SigJ [Sneathiellales bacterium]